MPSTDTKPQLTAKASMNQPVSQPAVYANGLTELKRTGRGVDHPPSCRTEDKERVELYLYRHRSVDFHI
jgi:hypothetical protein